MINDKVLWQINGQEVVIHFNNRIYYATTRKDENMPFTET